MQSGKIYKYLPEKGFGFIIYEPNNLSVKKEIFFHVNDMEGEPVIGQKVMFDIMENSRKQPTAIEVKYAS